MLGAKMVVVKSWARELLIQTTLSLKYMCEAVRAVTVAMVPLISTLSQQGGGKKFATVHCQYSCEKCDSLC